MVAEGLAAHHVQSISKHPGEFGILIDKVSLALNAEHRRVILMTMVCQHLLPRLRPEPRVPTLSHITVSVIIRFLNVLLHG